MRKVFRAWLDARFGEAAQELLPAFEEIKPVGGPGMAKGRAYRRRAGKSRFFVVMRYQSDRPRVFLSIAWNTRDSAPSDALRAETVAALRAAQTPQRVFERETGWLECGDWAGWPVNDFEPARAGLTDADIERLAAVPAVRTFWDLMGVPAVAHQATPFLRENVLTWDSVGDIAPACVREEDCRSYLGAIDERLRQSLRTVVPPAAQAWSQVAEPSA